jgi:Polyketide cyclase / dehydrase and lipid transport
VKSVTVSTSVSQPIQVVYDHLIVLANHAAFLDHFLVDWSFSGPASGAGAKAQARANAVGSQDWTDFEIVAAEEPRLIVEEGVGAGGKRRTRGNYRLEEAGDTETRVSFEFEWIEASRAERLCPPLTRAFIRRSTAKGLRRLASQLAPR